MEEVDEVAKRQTGDYKDWGKMVKDKKMRRQNSLVNANGESSKEEKLRRLQIDGGKSGGERKRSKSVHREMSNKEGRDLKRSKSIGREKGPIQGTNPVYIIPEYSHERHGRSKFQDHTRLRDDISWRSRSRERISWETSGSEHHYHERRGMSSTDGYGEVPCFHYNNWGTCNYESGHPTRNGVAKTHMCRTCFYQEGERRSHSEVECTKSNRKRDEPCNFFNNVGVCEYKSGHPSKCGLYSHVHICRYCFNEFGIKMFHPALYCRCKNNLQEKPTLQEKPCQYYNNTADCQLTSGHLNDAGFIKQVHICRCCLEFGNKIRHHAAVDCQRKETLVGGGRQSLFTEMPSPRKKQQPSSADANFRGKRRHYTELEGEGTLRKAEKGQKDEEIHRVKGKDVTAVIEEKKPEKSISFKYLNGKKRHTLAPKRENNEYKKRNISDEVVENDIRYLTPKKLNDPDDESTHGDISFHMNPDDRFPDETNLKEICNFTPAKSTSISSKLIHEIVHSTEEKIEKIEEKIRGIEKREKLKFIKESNECNALPKEIMPNRTNDKELHLLKQNTNEQILENSSDSDERRNQKESQLDGSKTFIEGAQMTPQVEKPSQANVVLVDKVLNDLPIETGNKDHSDSQEEIMMRIKLLERMKIEMLEKLQVIESRKMREARQQQEVSQLTQPNQQNDDVGRI